MIYLRLFFEFCYTGLFSVGGGLATIPFLQDMSERTGWFTSTDVANMIAVAESTPGPLGVNMASYVGFDVGGALGCVVATLGLITPSVIVILLVARFLQRFRSSRVVDGVFYGLRPASAGLIAAAGLEVAKKSLVFMDHLVPDWRTFLVGFFHWKAIILFVLVFVLYRYTPLKKLHPIVFILASAVLGAVFKM